MCHTALNLTNFSISAWVIRGTFFFRYLSNLIPSSSSVTLTIEILALATSEMCSFGVVVFSSIIDCILSSFLAGIVKERDESWFLVTIGYVLKLKKVLRPICDDIMMLWWSLQHLRTLSFGIQKTRNVLLRIISPSITQPCLKPERKWQRPDTLLTQKRQRHRMISIMRRCKLSVLAI